MTNKELVEKLNSLEIIQKNLNWAEDIPEYIWREYLEEIDEVDCELDIDKHRWYELSTEVIKINDGFIGIESITDLDSENSSVEDIYHTLKFFEMEELLIPSYVRKE